MERKSVPLDSALTLLGNPVVRKAAGATLRAMDEALHEAGAYDKLREGVSQKFPQAASALEKSRASRHRAEQKGKSVNAGCGCALRAADNISDIVLYPFSLIGLGGDDAKAVVEGVVGIATALRDPDKVGVDFSGRRVDMIDATLNIASGILPIPVLIAGPLFRKGRELIEDTALPPVLPAVIDMSQIKAKSLGMSRAMELPISYSDEYLWVKTKIDAYSEKKKTTKEEESQGKVKISDAIKNVGFRLQNWSHQEPAPIPDMYLHAFNGLLLTVMLASVVHSTGGSFRNFGGMLEVLGNIPTQGLEPVGNQLQLIANSIGKNVLAWGGVLSTLYANPFRRVDENSSVVLPVLGKTIEGWGNNIAAVEDLAQKIRTRVTPQ